MFKKNIYRYPHVSLQLVAVHYKSVMNVGISENIQNHQDTSQVSPSFDIHNEINSPTQNQYSLEIDQMPGTSNTTEKII